MNPALVIARLTIRESVRRWIVAACAAIALCLIGLSAWGFDRLSHSHHITSGEVGVAVPQSLILFMFTFSFVLALTAIATGVIGVALFGAAWLAGVVGTLGANFNISELQTVGQVSRYILPTDGLWRGAIYYLEPQSFVTQVMATSDKGNPFFAQAPPSWAYLLWVAVWFLAVLAAGLFSFQRREL